MIVCDKCSFEFNLKEMQEQKVNIKGNELLLTFFTCPKCNQIYKVTLDDEKSTELKEDLIKTLKRIRRNLGNNNIIFSDKLNSMLENKKKRLKKYMLSLNEKYNGTFTFDASENNEKENKIIYHE